MEENEDEPEDVRKATPVAEEIKKGETDEHSERPTRPFEDSTRKRHRCEKNVSKKKTLKSEGECCRAKLAKAAKAPKTATVFVYEKECVLPKIKAIPRHCLTKDEWIDILATPSRKCPSPCLQKAVTRRIRPVSARMAELAQPPKQRLLNTLQDRGGTLPTELVDNLIQTLEGETCLTPEQAEKMFRDKDNRAKKKCRKKNKTKCKSDKAAKNSEPGVHTNVSSLDKEAVHCQYLMAESFVKSILEWKCQIPREEFKDIADVILKRLGYILEYSPVNGEDRKSQQMRFLADIIASWISGVLFDVAEAKKTELEEECERKRKEKEEETDEESDDETDDESDDDDDRKRPGGRGGPPRRGKDDKRKKGGEDGKDDDDYKKPGKPGTKQDTKETLEAGEGKDSAKKVTEESPSKSPPEDSTTKHRDKETSEEEIFHDARAEPGSPPVMDEKKTPIKKPEDTKPEHTKPEDEAVVESKREKQKEEKSVDEIPKDSSIHQHAKPEDSSAKVETLTAKVKEEEDKHAPFEDLRDKAFESKQSPELVKGDERIEKQADDVTMNKSINALQQSEDKAGKISDEKKIGDAAAEYSQPLAAVKKPVEEKPMELSGEGIPIATAASSEESADRAGAKVTQINELEKEVIAGVPTDDRAAGDKVDDKDIAAKLTKTPEATSMLEAKKEEAAGAPSLPVDFGDAGMQKKRDSAITPSIPDSPTSIVEKEDSKKAETRKSIGDSSKMVPADEVKVAEVKQNEDEELKMKTTVKPSQDASIVGTAEKLKEDDAPKATAKLSKDPSIRVTAEELETAKIELKEDDEVRKIADPFKDPSIRLTADESKAAEIELKEDDELKKVIKPKDLSGLAVSEDSKESALDFVEDDEPKKSIIDSEDPSRLITKIESLMGKRKESEKKRPSKKWLDGKVVAKKYETDVPFVTFDKIFHTIYNAVEATNENPGDDSVTNRLHRSVYEKFSSVVQEEIPGPLPALTKDVLEVMSGKIALWIRDVLTDSQMSFMNKFPATVESIDVREWGNWIDHMFDTMNTWSRWIQQTIRQAEDMKSNRVTRRDWREWTKSVETDALRWRRFYLESLHQAHQNLTIIRDRNVVKTGTRRVNDQKEEYEKEMKITDLEVE